MVMCRAVEGEGKRENACGWMFDVWVSVSVMMCGYDIMQVHGGSKEVYRLWYTPGASLRIDMDSSGDIHRCDSSGAQLLMLAV